MREIQEVQQKSWSYLKQSGIGDKAFLAPKQSFLYLMMLDTKMI